MTLSTGQRLTGTQAMQLEAKTGSAAQASNIGSLQTLTTTETDLLNATVTITTTAASAAYLVIGAFDMDTNGVADVGIGRLSVDGATQIGEAHMQSNSAARMTVANVWQGTVGPGSHTFKLRGLKSGSAGTIRCYDTHTKILVQVSEQP